MHMTRDNRSLIAVLLGWCLFFNMAANCLHHGQNTAALLNGVPVAFCSLMGQEPLVLNLGDASAPGNLASLLGCPLCGAGSGPMVSNLSVGALALPGPAAIALWPEPVFSPGRATRWPAANPRASPQLV